MARLARACVSSQCVIRVTSRRVDQRLSIFAALCGVATHNVTAAPGSAGTKAAKDG
jgi:hypothetical protein